MILQQVQQLALKHMIHFQIILIQMEIGSVPSTNAITSTRGLANAPTSIKKQQYLLLFCC